MIPRARFISRRKSVQETLGASDAMILPSAPVSIKSNDVHHRFRQDSDFYYLTGFDEEESALVLYREKSILYLRKRDPDKETWTGPMLGIDRACEELGVDEARDIANFQKDLPDLLKKHERLHWFYGRSREMDHLVFETSDRLIRRSRAGESGPSVIVHAGNLLHEMRLTKDADEIALLRVSAEATREAHVRIMRETKPGMFEFTVEAMIQETFRRHDCVEAYPSIVASGPNACVLHHISNTRLIQEGDLILVDAGAERHCMNADVTRTYPAAEKFSPEQRDVYALVLHAQKNAIARTKPGTALDDVHNQTVRDLVLGLLDLGVLSGSADENIEKGTYRKYYMHRTGHWLGLDVHDVGAYSIQGKPRLLADGMVCTVEPGLYFPPDSPPAFRGIGVRIEDDVLVSGETPTVLTASIPKEIQDIEALRAS